MDDRRACRQPPRDRLVGAEVRPAILATAIVSLGWLIWRIATKDCCPHWDGGMDDDDTMPSAGDLLGIDPGWTGGLSVDEYMREQRER